MAVLADQRYDNDPVRDLLARLWHRIEEQVDRLERVADISDLYQSHVLESNRSLTNRYEKQLRQIKRVVRISDLYQASLKEVNLSLFEASTHDALTGISNRRFMAERCLEEDQRASRHGSTYSMIILDVDHFKLINDEYGHATGDLMLVDFVKALSSSLRHYDIIARWGGEEFLALLIDADLSTAEGVAKRMLANIRNMRVSIDDMELQLTASMGLTEHKADENYDATFRRADKALLMAKNGGRDRLVVIDPVDPLSHREICSLAASAE
ncbi:GGDEF domain-containing protein [Aphanothece cf. minutissima CCALA 015]|uniref:GGDEF domain-containing protein n=2 Tax=Aphanothece TaxID=1121 RepID=A0ABX5FC17_9CHRO|nr:GGDEF domain-containing protein [Aphanothece cf. minutissima CCALA 015]